jgi:hypothetical protein
MGHMSLTARSSCSKCMPTMVSRVGIEPTTRRLRVRIAPVSLSCAELLPGCQSVAESGLPGFGSSAECRPVRVSSAELSTASQPRFRESVPWSDRNGRPGKNFCGRTGRSSRRRISSPTVPASFALPRSLPLDRGSWCSRIEHCGDQLSECRETGELEREWTAVGLNRDREPQKQQQS